MDTDHPSRVAEVSQGNSWLSETEADPATGYSAAQRPESPGKLHPGFGNEQEGQAQWYLLL